MILEQIPGFRCPTLYIYLLQEPKRFSQKNMFFFSMSEWPHNRHKITGHWPSQEKLVVAAYGRNAKGRLPYFLPFSFTPVTNAS